MTVLKFVFHTINTRRLHTWIKPEGHNTGIKVYNCLVKEKVPFIVRDKNCTGWYTCGPTVYDSAHIGHASCYVKLDIIQRILQGHFGIKLLKIMNITDIDDKIIRRSNQKNISTQALAGRYENEFWEDLEMLNVMKSDLVVRVTEHIDVIENFVHKLLLKGVAYKSNDGSVLYNIQKRCSKHGKLQNISEEGDDDKSTNFALWKAPKENEPYWESSKCGPGRPGWHTECSSLASFIFGSSLDVHAGGIDLRFPHHENEELQCCSYFDQSQWVNYWLHTGHLLEKSVKMSKSLNNTLSIRDMLKLCNSDTFRMMCLMSHYRHNMEFTEAYIKNAQNVLDNYKNFVNDCNSFLSGKIKLRALNSNLLLEKLNETSMKLHDALCDDFNTSTCIKIFDSLVKEVNKNIHDNSESKASLTDKIVLKKVLNLIIDTFKNFGLDLFKDNSAENKQSDNFVNIIVNFRQEIRAVGISNKDKNLLKLCDNIRDELKINNIIVKDLGKTSSWFKN